MKKTIKIITTTILSIGLVSTTLTAYPQTLTETLASEASSAVLQDALETPNSDSQANTQTQEAVTTANNTESKPSTTTSAPRPRVQTSQASRGGQPTSSKSTTSKATAIINTAKSYIGVKYLWGGTTPSGFDCSGYTQYVFAKNGISLPRISRDQYNVGTSVSYQNLKPGDLVFFSLDGDKAIDHVGIFIGNGQFINASSSKGVAIYSMGSYWNSKYIGAKRVL
jgi:peptidoglycan DL-endopeptidase CwlO